MCWKSMWAVMPPGLPSGMDGPSDSPFRDPTEALGQSDSARSAGHAHAERTELNIKAGYARIHAGNVGELREALGSISAQLLPAQLDQPHPPDRKH